MRIYTTLVLCALAYVVCAQTPTYQDLPYGKTDLSDLQLTQCDFEKDANAEVLSNFGKLQYGEDLKSITLTVHKRIKIFNTYGNAAADIRISFLSYERMQNITGIEAQTVNLVDGQPSITKLDKKLIHTTGIDDERSEMEFAMPDVKPGCIIEYKYKLTERYNADIPGWEFQEGIPVRYCELSVAIPDIFYFRPQLHINLPLTTHTTATVAQVLKLMTHEVANSMTTTGTQETETYAYNNNDEVWGMANIPSLRDDAYISSFEDNVQRLNLDLVSMKPINGFDEIFSNNWGNVGYTLTQSADFGGQLNPSISNEDAIESKAALLKSDDEKIAYIFNEVKNDMKWNGHDTWYTVDGAHKAWENKSGNSTEINIILYYLLKKAKIEAYPMLVSTRENGKPDPWRTTEYEFNRAVVYVPVDSARNYVLDASGKYNLYDEAPSELLNSFGLCIDKANKKYDTVSIKKDLPVRQVILINAEIKPTGKAEGTAQILSSSYDRIAAVKKYKTEGDQAYTDSLVKGNNNLKISSVKFENMDVDTLPLTQNIAFGLTLAGSDENYIYLNPNIFTPLKANPFLADTRLTDIYYGFLRNYSINGVYKIPAGYKVDALPKNVSMIMPDKSIVFKRIVAEQDGSILVHFIIDIRKKAFGVDEYPGVHDFYKKMYEMLNEQIVLKKS